MLATSCGHTSLQLWKLDGKWYLLRVYPVRKPTDVLKNDVGKRTFLSSWDLHVRFHGRTMMLEMLNCFLASVWRHSAPTWYKEPNSAPDFHWSAFWNMVIYALKPKLLVDFPPFFMTLSLTQTCPTANSYSFSRVDGDRTESPRLVVTIYALGTYNRIQTFTKWDLLDSKS